MPAKLTDGSRRSRSVDHPQSAKGGGVKCRHPDSSGQRRASATGQGLRPLLSSKTCFDL